jgi:hypothetical protein
MFACNKVISIVWLTLGVLCVGAYRDAMIWAARPTKILWDPGKPDGTTQTYRVKCGQAPGSYPHITALPATSTAAAISDLRMPDGTYTCIVTALNDYGESPPSQPVTVQIGDETVDVTPPLVVIASPKAGSVMPRKSSVEIIVTAGDDSGIIAMVIVFVNNQEVRGCKLVQPPFRCVWEVPAPPGRSYRLQASARDGSGNVTLSPQIGVKSDGPNTQATVKPTMPKPSTPTPMKRTPWGTPEW